MPKDTPDSDSTVYHDEARALFAEKRAQDLELALQELLDADEALSEAQTQADMGVALGPEDAAWDRRGTAVQEAKALLAQAPTGMHGMPVGLSWERARQRLNELTHGRATEEQMNLMVTAVLAGDMKLVRTADGWLPVRIEQLEVWP